MAIDAGIYQNVKPVPTVDPNQVLTGVLTQQALIQKGKDEAQAQADDAETRRILQQYGGDLSQTTQALRAKGLYGPADAIEKADLERRKARAENLKSQLANQNTINSTLGGYVTAAKDGLTPDNAPQRLAVLRAQILNTPADPDDPPGTREQLAAQLAQFDPEKTPALLDQWANGLQTEAEQVKQHQETLDSLYGKDHFLEGAASILSKATDRQDYEDEYRMILSTVHDNDHRAAIAATFADPSKLTTPEAFKSAIQKAQGLATTYQEQTNRMNADTAAANAKKPQGFNLSQGQTRFEIGPDGKPVVVASVAPRPQAASGASTSASPSDAKAVADAIMNGDQPPEFTGLYRNTMAVRAELAKAGYPLTKATEDWTATKKYLTTLNGQQQTRLRQSVTFANDSLGLVQSLSDQWNGGQFPLLNKANLAAAKAGAYGKDAQSIATRLDAQIADLTSELGTVYKGGNSSTDESLKLAAQNLNANWSKQTLDDAIKQIRTNLAIRTNSIKNTGASGTENNQYDQMRGTEAPKSDVSSAVMSLLSTQKPGQYTLSDGHTYKKAADGTISVIK